MSSMRPFGWIVPPPSESRKSGEQFRREREAKVHWLEREGLVRSARIQRALLAPASSDPSDARPRRTAVGGPLHRRLGP
jgi:hypothetical protein